MRNILNFNSQKIEFPKDTTIKYFSELFFEKIKTGSYFIIKESNYTNNLNEYYNKDIINLYSINFEEFKRIKVKYDKVVCMDKNRYIGINSDKLDIFKINKKNKIELETSIKLDIVENGNYNIFFKYNIILVISDLYFYIINSTNLNIIKKVNIYESKTKEKKKIKEYSFWGREEIESYFIKELREYHQFTYGEIISENSIFIIYEGNLKYLDDLDNLTKFLNFPNDNMKFINIINCDNAIFDSLENSQEYIFLLIYTKKNDFELEKIRVLLKKHILFTDVSFVTSKHVQIEEDDCYCTFSFDHLNRLSEKEFIISFKTSIEADRNQYYFYIIDENYSNETILLFKY